MAAIDAGDAFLIVATLFILYQVASRCEGMVSGPEFSQRVARCLDENPEGGPGWERCLMGQDYRGTFYDAIDANTARCTADPSLFVPEDEENPRNCGARLSIF
jgi:hypothetical protein